MKEKRATGGFTLMEVLISIVILSLLMLVGSLSMSIFLDHWQKDRLESEKNIPQFIRWVLLKDAVEGAYDYYVKLSPGVTEHIPYFKTYEGGFEFTTVNPIWSKSETAIARVRFQQNGALYNLTYEESALDNKCLILWNDSPKYENSSIFIKGIRSYSIMYFGARDITTAGLDAQSEIIPGVMGTDEVVYDWFPTYEGNVRKILPRKISVALTFQNGDEQKLSFSVRTWNLAKTWRFNEM